MAEAVYLGSDRGSKMHLPAEWVSISAVIFREVPSWLRGWGV